jgi:hypothetical protein
MGRVVLFLKHAYRFAQIFDGSVGYSGHFDIYKHWRLFSRGAVRVAGLVGSGGADPIYY